MTSKRRIRRQLERQARLQREQLKEQQEMDHTSAHTGRTSVAELLLKRTKLLHPEKQEDKQDKPSIPKPVIAPVHEITAVGTDPLTDSERHKALIWKEAKENRDYYLRRQADSREKLPWFFYVRKEGQYSEFVMLNTEMSQALLDNIWKTEEGNRPLKIWLKEGHKRDILSGQWIPSDEAIGIDFNHVVYNGRHRMTAMVESKKEWPWYITFNCLEEAKLVVDSGAKRSSVEKLRLVMDTKLGNRTTGFCKAVMRGIQNRVRYTESEIVEFAHKWSELIHWVSVHLPAARAEVQAAVAKAYLWYGGQEIEPFCDRLKNVRFPEDGDPAKALYVALERSKVNRSNQTLVSYKKTLAAIDALMTKRAISKLYEKEEDIFQWQDGWELPNKV